MTDTPISSAPERPPLNVIDIVTSTFSVYWRGLFYFLPVVLLFSIAFEVVGAEISAFITRTIVATIWLNLFQGLGNLLGGFFYNIAAQALVVLPAIHLYRDGKLQIFRSVRGLLLALLPVTALSVIVSILTMIGFVFLVVPGIVISLMLFVAMPILLDERAGLRAIPRSMNLTRDYRWSLLGLSILISLITLIVGLLFSLGLTPALLWIVSLEIYNDFLVRILSALINSLSYVFVVPIGGISVVIAYTRLKEIKEGGETGDLLKVFE